MRLTPKQAAARAGVSVNLVYVWCQQRELPHYRMGGQGKRGRILIDECELIEFLERRRVEPALRSMELRHVRLE